MPSIQSISSRLTVTFSEIEYLIGFIQATQHRGERNRALNQLWTRTAELKFLVKLLKEKCSPPSGTEQMTSFSASSISATTNGSIQQAGIMQAGPMQTPEASHTAQTINPDSTIFTREDLAKFNGKDGKPAYVSVNGIVYDVTNNAAWSLATHFGLTAGRDLTAEFSSCHQGQQWILAQLKPVGRLV